MDASAKEFTTLIASGDAEAFAAFFRERFDNMYAEARRVTGRDEAFCLDVVQDAMVRVIKSMRRMDTEEKLRNWLRVVVQTCAYDRLRAETRQRRREHAYSKTQETSWRDNGLDEQLVWLQRELADLEDFQAQLLTMRYRFGWTLQRIGAVVGLKPGAVDGRIGRLVASLRRRSQETFHD